MSPNYGNVWYLDPGAAPLATLTARSNSRAVLAPRFTWPRERFWQPDEWNYLQIFRTPFRAADGRQRKERALVHLIEIEKSFLYGARGGEEIGGSGAFRRWTGGLAFFATKNQRSLKGDYEAKALERWWKRVVPKGQTGLLLASPLVCSVVDVAFPSAPLPLAETYGIPCRQAIIVEGRRVIVVKDRVLQSGDAFCVLPQHLGYRYLQGRDIQIRPGTVPVVDGPTDEPGPQMDEWLCEVGLEVRSPSAHGRLRWTP